MKITIYGWSTTHTRLGSAKLADNLSQLATEIWPFRSKS
jgi:hypothetical protein